MEALEEPTFDQPNLTAAFKQEEEIVKLEEKARVEIDAILLKYLKLKAPILSKRNELANQTTDFWKTALLNNPNLHSILLEKEEPVERDAKEPRSYKLIFLFDANEFFSNKQIVREVKYKSHDQVEVVNHPINWKVGKKLSSEPHIHGEGCGNKKRKLEDGTEVEEPHVHEDEGFFDWIESEDTSVDAMFLEDFYENATRYFAGIKDDDDEEEDEEEDELD